MAEAKKQVLKLAMDPELTLGQIAQQVDVSIASVSKWIKEAREESK